MENKQGTSFIPKSPTRAAIKPKGVRRVFILTYVTSVFFFGTIIATIVIFVWGATITTQLEDTKTSLAEKKTSFNQQGLAQVRDIDSRLKASTNVLNSQVSVTKLFTTLEKTIYFPIQVTGFEYKKNEAGSLDLAFSIRARTFNDAIAQRDSLLSDPIFTGATISAPVFSDPKPPEDAPYLSSKEVVYVFEKELSSSDIPYQPSGQNINTQEGAQDNILIDVTSPEDVNAPTTAPVSTKIDLQESSPAEQPVDITDSISN